MKICFTAEEFIPSMGGRAMRIYETARALAERHNVHVVCQRYPKTDRESIIEGIHVHRVGFVQSQIHYLQRLVFSPFLLPSLLKIRFDIINTSWLLPPIISYASAKITKTPIVFTSDGILWGNVISNQIRGYGFIREAFGRMMEDIDLKPDYDGYIAVSQGTKSELTLMGIHPSKVFVVPNGVDLDLVDSVEAMRAKAPTICYVGHLEPRKNIMDLIEAFKIVLQEVPIARLLVVGSGNLMGEAMERAKALAIKENIEFKGALPHEEAIKTMKTSDCLVLPSLIEGFGIVLAEANACHRPAIAYDIPNVRDVIKDGFNGFLVKPRNIKMLTSRIIEILSDRKKGKKMGENGRRLVEEKFTWRKVAEQTLNVYRKVLELSI